MVTVGQLRYHDRDVAINTFVMQERCPITVVSTLAERVKQRREELGYTQKRLAELSGVKQTAIANIEAGTRSSPRSLVEIAVALGVRPEWLKTGRSPDFVTVDATGRTVFAELKPGPQAGFDLASPESSSYGRREVDKLPIDIGDNPLYPAIRRVRFKLSAGASGFEVDYLSNGDGTPIVFRKDWYDSRGLRPEALFAVRVSGSSMEPKLYEGDTVVVNTADTTPKDGEVFAINYEGELVIKRLERDAGQWWMRSDNPDQSRFPRKACTTDAIVIGRIVHKQSEHI
jgi:phage repressor protein C with HTH and peptisase S24 domain